MDYGGPYRAPTEDDLQVLHCPKHGWSMPITKTEVRDRGLPLYCDVCGEQAGRFINYHPEEEPLVADIIGDAPRWFQCRPGDTLIHVVYPTGFAFDPKTGEPITGTRLREIQAKRSKALQFTMRQTEPPKK